MAAAENQLSLDNSDYQGRHAVLNITPRPMVGIGAVLLGAVISTLAGRLTTFGLADVRGAVHAGFDEGAWIPTAFTVGQMLIGPIASWLGVNRRPILTPDRRPILTRVSDESGR